jgi:hypothetical protein
MKRLSLVVALLFTVANSDLLAQGKLELESADTIVSILQRNVGQTVELRLASGEKIGGKVEKVGLKLIHLSHLTGADYYDAAVDASNIAAVIVRTKGR